MLNGPRGYPFESKYADDVLNQFWQIYDNLYSVDTKEQANNLIQTFSENDKKSFKAFKKSADNSHGTLGYNEIQAKLTEIMSDYLLIIEPKKKTDDEHSPLNSITPRYKTESNIKPSSNDDRPQKKKKRYGLF